MILIPVVYIISSAQVSISPHHVTNSAACDIIESVALHLVRSSALNSLHANRRATRQLQVGDTVSTDSGYRPVIDIQRCTLAARVINLEVHGDHVYRDGQVGKLVHNIDSSVNKIVTRRREETRRDSEYKTSLFMTSSAPRET